VTQGNRMKPYQYLVTVGAVLSVLVAVSVPISAASTVPSTQNPAVDSLCTEISALDEAVFDAFKRYNKAASLQSSGSYHSQSYSQSS
jgi:hypothetical protein